MLLKWLVDTLLTGHAIGKNHFQENNQAYVLALTSWTFKTDIHHSLPTIVSGSPCVVMWQQSFKSFNMINRCTEKMIAVAHAWLFYKKLFRKNTKLCLKPSRCKSRLFFDGQRSTVFLQLTQPEVTTVSGSNRNCGIWIVRRLITSKLYHWFQEWQS